MLLVIGGGLFMSASAQGHSINGSVKDDTGAPLPGVNVVIKGTMVGTISDIDGNYRLENIAENAVLVFSFVGFDNQEITVGSQTTINVVLIEETSDLDEVVVVGYGVQKKSDLTGSIGSVDNQALTGKGATTVMESLQGSVAGVDISQSSSRVGESFSMSIRGKSTLGSSTSPLFVVDGMVVDDINFLNPSDIEKIDILKDASSTAIYGSRATNGVVIVTTKQAQAGKSDECMRVDVSYDGYVGMKRVARMPDFMDDVEWMDYRYMKYVTPTKDGIVDGRLQLELTSGNLKSVWNDKGTAVSTKMRDQFLKRDFTDWRDLMMKEGTQQNHFVQVSGVGKQVSYRLGVGYQKEDGIMGDGLNQFNFKSSIDAKISDKWMAGGSANLSATYLDLGSQRAVQESFRANGYWLPYNTETGELNYQPGKDLAPGQSASSTFPAGFSSSVSPLIDEINSEDLTRSYRILGNAYVQFKPINDVVLKTTFSPTVRTSRRGKYYGGLSSTQSGTYNVIDNPTGTSSASLNKKEAFSYTWDTQANYTKTIADVHSINAMALFSVYSSENESSDVTAEGVTKDTYWYNLGTGSSYSGVKSSYSKSTMLSYALRLNYAYAGKYLLTLSSRWDGSSKFQDGNKWGVFPSAAVAWRLSEESFIKDNVAAISNLKIRGSYGVTGNNASVGNYETIFLANQQYYAGVGKGYGPEMINEDLTWEKTNELDLGVDFGLFSNRLSGTVDWYRRDSKDLLMDQKLLLEQGSSSGSVTGNVGKVRNQGIELMLKGIIIQNKDFYWDVALTYAKNKNEIIELQGKKDDMRANRWFIGEAIDVIYDLKQAGICTKDMATSTKTINGDTKTLSEWYGYFEGCMTYNDLNNDGKINDEDRQIIGHTMPTWTGTISTSFSYKNWDLSASVNIKEGQTVESPFMQEFTDYSDRGRTKLKMDFYIPEGAPIFNYDWDKTNTASLTSDPSVRATKTIKGTSPYPFNDAKFNHGGGNGWYTGKNTEFKNNICVDASYVKIKNITLGYTFDKDLMSRIGVKSLRVYANVLNPFVFTDYKGFDPEWADAGISDGTGGPASVTYQFGVNVKF